MLAALICVLPAANAHAQQSSVAEEIPEAVALSCFGLQTERLPDETRLYAANSCDYPINVAACMPSNAKSSLLCKTGDGDISRVTWKIRAKSRVETNLPDGAALWPMACKAPAKPVMLAGPHGKCVKAD